MRLILFGLYIKNLDNLENYGSLLNYIPFFFCVVLDRGI